MTKSSGVFIGNHVSLTCSLFAAAAAMCSACGADQRQHLNPAAPSAIVDSSPAISTTPLKPGVVVELPRGGQPIGPADVTFPPRNEPMQFRAALEAKYRDGLRRSPTNSFVDQEGTVVWTQEYLRYRVNLCSHSEAVDRVFAQIDGQGIQGPCGTTTTVVFPPRNEPLDFMLQLEGKYRDGLRRTSGPSYVDTEGNVIWVQEYLRYRVNGCDHASAQTRVFTQIDGGGVPGGCVATDGLWIGTTSQSRAITFTVGNGLVTSLGFSASLTGSRGVGCVVATSFPLIPSTSLTGTNGGVFSLSATFGRPEIGTTAISFSGSYSSNSTASGTLAVTSTSANSCVTTATVTWNATRS